MYFPFLRGKLNELMAIEETTNIIVKSGKITPIIEPVNLNSTTRRTIPKLIESKVPLVFIINPKVGDLAGQNPEIFHSLLNAVENKSLITLGYFITEKTTFSEIENIMTVFADFSFAFIHATNSSTKDELLKIGKGIRYHIFLEGKVSSSYLDAFNKKKRIIIKDCFNARSRNVDYIDEEYFSDLFSKYSPDFFGFGDFQIIGAGISGGGPAHAVALHLTYLKDFDGREIWVKHFISDDTQTSANIQGKYFQALKKLVAFLDAYENTPETIGATDYRNNLKNEKFPGLGLPKRWSMKHHFELITQVI